MNSIDKLFKLADRFAHKISLAQSGQAGDAMRILKEAGLWDIVDQVNPILDELNIPPEKSIALNIVIDSGFNISYPSQPPMPALSAKLKAKFGALMATALKNGKILDSSTPPKEIGPFRVSGTLTVNWLRLGPQK